ncbi:unnamed protein product, partial [Prunus brigantina]
MEDVLLCEGWVQVDHCPVTGNEMKFSHMRRKIHAEFCERSGSARTEMALSSRQKSFNHDQCWEAVKNCSRFRIITTGPTIVLNKTSFHDSTASNSPLDSPMSQDASIQMESRPIGRKAAKAKRGSTSSNDTAKNLEQIARNGTMRIELDMKKDADEKAMNEEYAREMEYICKQDIEKKDRETMAMDTSHVSPETKQLKK